LCRCCSDVHDADILLERAPVATASEYDASPAYLHSDDDDVRVGGYQLSDDGNSSGEGEEEEDLDALPLPSS